MVAKNDYRPGFPRPPKDEVEQEAMPSENGRRCKVLSDLTWFCTRPKGHPGDHVASDCYDIIDRWEATENG
jgi:hypothetical protein